MVSLKPENGTPISGSKLSWLGSREGVATARTGTLSGLTGEVKSGTPVTETGDGMYGAYDGSKLSGFVLHPVNVVAGAAESVAIIDRGRVRVDRLPAAFTPPANSGRFTFVGIEAEEGGE